jgi:hypothetical protein
MHSASFSSLGFLTPIANKIIIIIIIIIEKGPKKSKIWWGKADDFSSPLVFQFIKKIKNKKNKKIMA